MIQNSPLTSVLFGQLLGDAEAERWLNDHAQIQAMLTVEAELALAQAEVGLIPEQAAEAIAQTARGMHPTPETLAAGTLSAGVPVPALVQSLKQALAPEHARWVHYGATSQDIVDTALVLNVRSLLTLYEQRLDAIVAALAELAEHHRQTLISGRTRTQRAVPISLGLKMARWLAPLVTQKNRLPALRQQVLKLQLGGAVGTLSVMGERAEAAQAALARRLDLTAGPSWHTQRDGLVELSHWLGLTTGSLGKMAQDWLWLSQSEVGEIRFSNGGGSSTMPQKCNPVSAEVMVALARHGAGLVGQMHQSMLQEHERGGSGWVQEWLALPQQLETTAVALKHGQEALAHLEIQPARIDANLEADNGAIYAEAATFELAATLPRDQATTLVKNATEQARADNRHLLEVVQEISGVTLDLDSIRQRLLGGGASQAWLDTLLADARRRR
ncbi:MAG: lyase family protein [Pseudomonadota bacterium]|nr:lyase family protein [Pseudomonadota bacterium]